MNNLSKNPTNEEILSCPYQVACDMDSKCEHYKRCNVLHLAKIKNALDGISEKINVKKEIRE